MYCFYEQMSHEAQGILCSASCDPDLQLFHQVPAHAVEITRKPEWEKGDSFLMRHPGWKMESIYLTGTKCAWWKAEAHSFLFHKKICHINGKNENKTNCSSSSQSGSWLSMPVRLMFNTDVQPTAAPQLGKTELETCDPQTSAWFPSENIRTHSWECT